MDINRYQRFVLFIMLVLPLATVLTEALKSGWQVFWDAVSDEYTLKAVLLTLEATACAVVFNTIFGLFAAWSVTKFQFKGKKFLPHSSTYPLPYRL